MFCGPAVVAAGPVYCATLQHMRRRVARLVCFRLRAVLFQAGPLFCYMLFNASALPLFLMLTEVIQYTLSKALVVSC